MISRAVKFLFVGLTISSSLSIAATPAISREHQVNLNDHAGKTFLQVMLEEEIGIKAQFDSDYQTEYTIADWSLLAPSLDNFDTKIVRKLKRSFPNGIEGLKALATEIEGEPFTPSSMFSLVSGRLPGGDIYAVTQFLAMASGAGTLVSIDDQNYFYNYGYKSGAHPDDVKSGRSFGAGPLHDANDASDVFYLDELEKYMRQTQDLRPFFRAILQVLLKTDRSGFAALSPLGQTAATDFLAIYTAESDRHIMVGLSPVQHPWENDLAEATFVSAFASAAGKIMIDGSLQSGRLRQWWAMSKQGNGRSGIGITRSDRRKLQRLIARHVRSVNPGVLETIEKMTGRRKDGDVLRGLMEYLNNYDTQDGVVEHADALIDAVVDLLNVTREDAANIEARVLELQ